MNALIANIKHAIRNRETTTIGGGAFGPEEMKELVQMHESNEELLAALNWISTVNAMDYEYQAIARAAIAKATGETK